MSDINQIIRALSLENTENFSPHFPLAKWTWFRVGGPAQWLFSPTNIETLRSFIKIVPNHVPLTILGNCSNVIIRDGGIDGITIHMGRHFSQLEQNDMHIIAQAGCAVSTISHRAQLAGIGGLEFLSAIPGSLGGSIVMNAGAHGHELSENLVWVDVITSDGQLHRLSPQDMNFSYRHSQLPEGAIVVRAAVRGYKEEPKTIKKLINEIKHIRAQSQPRHVRTSGSTFKNPSRAITMKKAWQLIDDAQCRGLTLGGAQISPKHCNFMLNLGDATADDLEMLGEKVRRSVYKQSGIELQWEIQRLGKKVKKHDNL